MGTRESETYGESQIAFRCNPSLTIIYSNSIWSLSTCPRDTAELKSPAESLKDFNLLPSGQKPHRVCIFPILQTHPADILRKAMPNPPRHKSTAWQPSCGSPLLSAPSLTLISGSTEVRNHIMIKLLRRKGRWGHFSTSKLNTSAGHTASAKICSGKCWTGPSFGC